MQASNFRLPTLRFWCGWHNEEQRPAEREIGANFWPTMQKMDSEKLEMRTEAKELQAESRKLGEGAEAKLRPHERLALTLAFLQIAIALEAIAVLTM